jgi:hypothetical protein
MLVRIAEVVGPRTQTIRNQRGHFHARTSRYRCCCSYPGRVRSEAIFFSAPTVEAAIHAGEDARMNVLQMHIDYPNMKNLPVQDVKDPI